MALAHDVHIEWAQSHGYRIVAQTPSILFACSSRHVPPDLGGAGDSTSIIVAEARLDNTSEMLRHLVPPQCGGRPTSDVDVIHAAWNKWGKECVRNLQGDFAFAAWDSRSGELLLARDRHGVKPLYILENRDLICFSSLLQDLRYFPGVETPVELLNLAMGIAGRYHNTSFTAFACIRRLPPAHTLFANLNSTSTERYWSLDPEYEEKLPTDDDYAHSLRELFTQAVTARMSTPCRVAAALSGGLDSSSICAVASRVLREQERESLIAVSAMLPSSSPVSEEKYIRAVVEHCRLRSITFSIEGMSPTARLSENLRSTGSPFLAGNLYGPDHAYSLAARAGAQVYMDGYDGDNAIGHGIELFPYLARRGSWIKVYSELKKYHANGGLYGRESLTWSPQIALRNYLWHFYLKPSFPIRLCSRASSRIARLLPSRPPRHPTNLVGAIPFKNAIARDLRELERARQSELRPRDVPRHAYIDAITSGQQSWLLELTHAISRSHGLDVRVPYFDTRLIEFCAAMPIGQKMRNGVGRWVMRNAMENILPDVVRLRPEKSSYESNFAEVFRQHETVRCTRLLIEGDSGLDALLDMDAVRKLAQDFVGGNHASDTLSALYRILVSAVWIDEGWADSTPPLAKRPHFPPPLA